MGHLMEVLSIVSYRLKITDSNHKLSISKLPQIFRGLGKYIQPTAKKSDHILLPELQRNIWRQKNATKLHRVFLLLLQSRKLFKTISQIENLNQLSV